MLFITTDNHSELVNHFCGYSVEYQNSYLVDFSEKLSNTELLGIQNMKMYNDYYTIVRLFFRDIDNGARECFYITKVSNEGIVSKYFLYKNECDKLIESINEYALDI